MTDHENKTEGQALAQKLPDSAKLAIANEAIRRGTDAFSDVLSNSGLTYFEAARATGNLVASLCLTITQGDREAAIKLLEGATLPSALIAIHNRKAVKCSKKDPEKMQ
ncbi:MAG: hypothetical protein JJ891_16925 [Rhizobiaceae bacterium]|jgi:hypothetical protein|nr:hypothetical protein [Rhizobiaceae bacterium]